MVPLALLAALVAIQVFNPDIESLLVGLVGLKVWLFYIPMAFIGYHLVRSRRDLDRVLKLMCMTALVPAIVGIVEAVLLYTGNSSLVYSLYGDAAYTSTQGFAAVQVGGATLLRVPSTFSFVAQYYVFMTAMVAIGYAWWRMAPPNTSQRHARVLVWAILLIAVLTSGARGAIAFIPLLLLAILIIEGGLGTRAIGVLVTLGVGLLLTFGLVGANPTGVVGSLLENARIQFDTVIVTGAEEASKDLLTGIGTGTDTNAIRYVTDDEGQQFSATNGWQESYWAKSILELGIGGFILVIIALGAVFVSGVRTHRRLRDPGLRALSASILGLMVWAFANTPKGQYLDFDPLNIYFWLFAGILFKLAVLDRERSGDRTSPNGRSDRLNGELVSRPPDGGVQGTPGARREPAHARG